MVELSSKVRYGLLALLELVRIYQRGEFQQIEQIAATHQIPERYLAQLLMTLRRCGIVRSQRGAKGGYALARDPRQIVLWEILICLEGRQKAVKEEVTSATPENYAIGQVWQETQQAAIAILQGYTLQDLSDKRDEGQAGNMYYI
ncbi:RrF2 family transcriptional regulator [Chroococcidiopsis sp.]|uniref:RrF2 family transcriptional regulator n=1 Tax=Chroococcidiopsis sp. TaxID=3088168 RepID=UPI003F34E0A3